MAYRLIWICFPRARSFLTVSAMQLRRRLWMESASAPKSFTHKMWRTRETSVTMRCLNQTRYDSYMPKEQMGVVGLRLLSHLLTAVFLTGSAETGRRMQCLETVSLDDGFHWKPPRLQSDCERSPMLGFT